MICFIMRRYVIDAFIQGGVNSNPYAYVWDGERGIKALVVGPALMRWWMNMCKISRRISQADTSQINKTNRRTHEQKGHTCLYTHKGTVGRERQRYRHGECQGQKCRKKGEEKEQSSHVIGSRRRLRISWWRNTTEKYDKYHQRSNRWSFSANLHISRKECTRATINSHEKFMPGVNSIFWNETGTVSRAMTRRTTECKLRRWLAHKLTETVVGLQPITSGDAFTTVVVTRFDVHLDTRWT